MPIKISDNLNIKKINGRVLREGTNARRHNWFCIDNTFVTTGCAHCPVSKQRPLVSLSYLDERWMVQETPSLLVTMRARMSGYNDARAQQPRRIVTYDKWSGSSAPDHSLCQDKLIHDIVFVQNGSPFLLEFLISFWFAVCCSCPVFKAVYNQEIYL